MPTVSSLGTDKYKHVSCLWNIELRRNSPSLQMLLWSQNKREEVLRVEFDKQEKYPRHIGKRAGLLSMVKDPG